MQNVIFSKRDNITLIDTCSLLALPASELYLRKLKSSRGKVIVLWAVIDELRKKIRSKDYYLSERAQKIFDLVFAYEARGVVTVGLDDDKDSRNFADNIFLGAVFKYGLRNHITVITQDKKLAEDLLSTKNSKSVNGLNVTVKRLESDGTLSEVKLDDETLPTERSNISMNNSKNALDIPASQLLQQFRTNREASTRVYRNQCLKFSGKIVRTYLEGKDFITELMADDETGRYRGRIICRFQGSASHEAKTFERGQPVIISGILNSVDTDFGDIELSDCSVYDGGISSGYTLPRKLFSARVTTIPEDRVQITQRAETGSKVKGLSGREYILAGIIARGRRSVVYEAEYKGETGDWAAKIYAPEFCTIRQLEKLRYIISLDLKSKGICFPADVLLNERGEFCGCIMPRAEGGSIEELFCTASEFERRFPDWKKTDMVLITREILERIKYLHDNGVIMGNVTPENIMFTSTEEVYMIDADAWQYGEFPCTSGEPDEYGTAPELQGRELWGKLRSIGSENFGVATLVFRLMMQGYAPYASYDRGLPGEEIRAGKFPYSVGEFKPVKDYKAPAHEARRIWSHLVRQLKDSFIQTFHEKGEHFMEDSRYSVEQWIKDVGYYYSCLPKMIKTDPASEEVFPQETRKALDKLQTR